MTEWNRAVFLSYASQDAEAARRICDALREAGIEVWFDQSELRGGDAWDRKIREQIRACELFIPIISGNSQDRLEGYFRREWKLAVERKRDMADEKPFLVPVVIDATPERSAAVPEGFHDVQWTRLPGGETTSTFTQRIAGLIAPNPGIATATGPGPAAPDLPRPLNPARSRLWTAVAGLALVIASVGGALIWRYFGAHSAANSVAVPDKSIAVLPFTDLSEKHDQEYFADGMADEILDLLAKLPGLRVIGRTSSFQFRSKAADVREIGKALNVSFVLEGSVRRAGDEVRVTAQLLSAKDGTHRWSDTYAVHLADVLKVQDMLANGIARTLEVAVSDPPESDSLSTDPVFYDLFMQGRQAMDTASKDGCERAAALFSAVLEKYPRSKRTLESIALDEIYLANEGWVPPKEGFESARRHAEQALQIDQKSATAHTVLADVHLAYDWDWRGADAEIDAALAAGPPSPLTLMMAAWVSSAQGRWTQAARYGREALAKDPLDPLSNMVLGAFVYLRSGREMDAEPLIRRALQIRPKYGSGQYVLSICLLKLGRLQEAFAEAEKEDVDAGRYEAEAAIFHAMHKLPEASAALNTAIDRDGAEWPSAIARIYGSFDKPDQALQWLNKAYDARDPDLFMIKGDPQLENLQTDVRYRAFLRKMNLPE
jgi:TolB-like protein/tetratricopeptide (TPR) repeat protein